ncbi:hypothetical protein G7Z17_g8578 [Cylindrodendrum hubeiense]|uniref:SET domain-containing protein n=1 Tax=Cylindrodendrum hubeiense TaxID=595255 RepID=A0A9P5LEJ8_9HYPO|nr:hypothetical protein G7Z17_g8578 [Cylindrodendrum hubeiense]
MVVDIDLTQGSSSDSEGFPTENFSHLQESPTAAAGLFPHLNRFDRTSTTHIHRGPLRPPISPPPIKRPSGTIISQAHTLIPLPLQAPTPTSRAPSSSVTAVSAADDARDMARLSGVGVSTGSQQVTPPLELHPVKARQPAQDATPKAVQTPRKSDWSVRRIVDSLNTFRQDIKNGHAQLAAYIIDSTEATERRVHTGTDLFASLSTKPVVEKPDESMRVKFKQHRQHSKVKKDGREERHGVVCIQTDEERVPRYRFHHVEIKKNMLTPNTMLTFVPHLRDLESSEESKYNVWLQELEDIDRKSGFKPMSREDKVSLTVRSEYAATVSLYLEGWLEKLAIPGCNKSTLIRYMASQEPDDAITPRQKTDILNSHREVDTASSSEANKAAEMFTEAFHLVFHKDQPHLKQIELRDVLLLDESVDSIMDSKPTAKDNSSSQNENEDELAEYNLGTYCILGCLICYSHSCEHGEYDAQNCKRTFSIISRLSDTLKRRRRVPVDGDGLVNGHANLSKPCNRSCYHMFNSPPKDVRRLPWSEDEHVVLRSILVTAERSKVKRDPMCLVADFLDRDCYDVFREYELLQISLPQPQPASKQLIRTVSWYDRFKKTLIGDWQDHTASHEHQRRELFEPCSHDGPCTLDSCTPCICVQLNRECDPELCGTCGAFERADPENAEDETLHSTGCQNCALQRGAPKALLLGQSQLEGVGYGLYTAQDIAQDDFIIEYVGELISHDEGVRREARRGDVFDEESNISYVFTLLENEGIWVDAAIYGNLSRYINHASESDKRGCNITPRILYVNGEYRIKFTAMRDIEAGEELFFNYGENFPNLTKKLLDHKAGGKSEQVKKRGRRSRPENTGGVARKAPKADKKKPGKPKAILPAVPRDPEVETKPMLNEHALEDTSKTGRKRKRGMRDDSEEEEYHPTGTDATASYDESQSPETIDSDEPLTKPPTRLRKRTRQQPVKGEASEQTGSVRGEPKTRGKRGGARPGSGRPRKYPRLGPKSAAAMVHATPSVPTYEQPKTEVPEQIEVVSPELGPVTVSTFQPLQPSRASAEEIDDSEDAADESMQRSIGDQYDEEEEEDVMVRQRLDRGMRNRRPPAKFREEDQFTAQATEDMHGRIGTPASPVRTGPSPTRQVAARPQPQWAMTLSTRFDKTEAAFCHETHDSSARQLTTFSSASNTLPPLPT